MASGFGLNGGPSRCFPFWQEVLACYVVNTDADNDSGKHKCKPVLDDYYECLHHKKEVPRHHSPLFAATTEHPPTQTPSNTGLFVSQAAKISALQAAYRRREAQTPRDQVPSAGEIRSLGLLDRKAEEVDISAASAIPRYSSNAPGGETVAQKVGLE
ncbi:hypothetical protein LTR29_011555 [Friedmanniomyces endolithicus]|nr:hypothetical protein LTR29_011555 [Friedmanniomyces endolithicus]